MPKYNFTYEFPRRNNSKSLDEVLKYWENQNFKCNLDDRTIHGRRGSLFHNLYTLNMKKLSATLEVKLEDANIFAKITVSGLFQVITEYNLYTFWNELIKFRCFIEDKGELPVFEEFEKASRASSWLFTFSLGKKGLVINDTDSEICRRIGRIFPDDKLLKVTKS